jgi:hypothetical protein
MTTERVKSFRSVWSALAEVSVAKTSSVSEFLGFLSCENDLNHFSTADGYVRLTSFIEWIDFTISRG